MQLLVFENLEPIHRLIATCLREQDCEVSHRPIPHDPELVGRLPDADIVFVSAYRPFRSAVAVIEHYANQADRPSIVALTPESFAAEQVQLLDAGAHYVVEMPFRPHEIQRVFERALQDLEHGEFGQPS